MRTIINLYRLLPLVVVIKLTGSEKFFLCDANRWKKVYRLDEVGMRLISKLMLDFPEYRNILQKRLRECGGAGRCFSKIIHILFPPIDTLYINTGNIGEGLFIQHGFSTIISAKSVGKYCWINQQVTIGYEGDKNPIIGDNVRICAGAIIIGDVTIGNNAVIGAGAVVTKDVPEGEVWAGVPAKFIKRLNKIEK